jgi:hypothetical protein
MSIFDDIAKAFEDAIEQIRRGVEEVYIFIAEGAAIVIETVETGVSIAARACADFVEDAAFVVVREVSSAAEALKQTGDLTWTAVRAFVEGGKPAPPPVSMGARVRDPQGDVYLMLDGRLRHVPNRATYDRLFKTWGGFTDVPRAAAYPMGEPLDENARLVRDAANGRIYLVGHGIRRWIISRHVFDRYGFNPTTAANISERELADLPEGPPISGEYIPDGRRVVDPASGAIYLMICGELRHIPNPATYNALFRDWNGIAPLGNLAGQRQGPPLTDGAHLAMGTPDGKIFMIVDWTKRWIESPAAMDRYQFKWAAVRTYPADQLAALPDGASIA